MNTERIVAALDDEIGRLEKARMLLGGQTLTAPQKRRGMSAEGRARVAAAQKKRWAKLKKQG